MKTIEKQLRTLTHMVPNAEKKAAFRHVLEQRVQADMRMRAAENALERTGWTTMLRAMFHAPSFALAIIIVILGSGTGITYAAQGAVPGSTLYGIKRGTERARLFVAPDEKTKASLHIEFASRRMREIEQLISTNTASDTVVADTVTQYENELNEGEHLLEKNPDAAQDITALLAATESHKDTITALKDKLAARTSGHLDTRLDEAYEHAESQSDAALLTALSAAATSTDDEELPKAIVDSSRKKVHALENEIRARKRAIENARKEQHLDDAAVSDAVTKLNSAQAIVDTAKTQLENNDYRASVEHSIQARELMKEASSWNKEKGRGENRGGSDADRKSGESSQDHGDTRTSEQER